ITRSHWEDFRAVAGDPDRPRVLLIRAGKPAAIPWIEKNFPAKPMAFKSKVDPVVGLLFARTRAERDNALAAGHLVLDRLRDAAGMPRHTALPAFVGEGRDPRGQPVRKVFNKAEHPWAQEALIVDSTSLKPFTSDYDLAAVIDPS